MRARRLPYDKTMQYIADRNLWKHVALECGIESAAVRQWHQVPPLRVIEVEKATGISRHDIRPDLYPRSRPPTAGSRRVNIPAE
jgi:hypothetical protein